MMTLLMDRKTKRHSPPLDSHRTGSKWSKVLHLISPPNKKRRSIAIIQDWSSDDDNEYMEALKKEFSLNQLNKQKILNRRAMYIPSPPDDGPKDAAQQWSLYRSTYAKLRQNTLPLSETIHLRKMLTRLQPQLKQQPQPKQEEDEEDDVPLGTLLGKNKSPKIKNRVIYQTYPTPHSFYHMPYYQPSPYYYYKKPQYI